MTTPIATTPAMTGSAQPISPLATSGSAPTDFMMLLAQIVGQPAQQAITPIPMQAVMTSTTSDGSDPEETLPVDPTELLAFAQALHPLEARPSAMSVAAQNAFLGGGAAPVGQSASTIASQVELVTEMIAAEQQMNEAAGAEADVFQLPISSTEGGQHRAPVTDPVTRPIHVPVGNAQWADELGSRLTTMTEQGRHAASLRLSPEHLGPLEIRIAIRDDQASVWFGAAHADTRAAIEHALPRLRDMFEAQGMALADAGVYHEAPQEQPHPTATTHAPSAVDADMDVSSSGSVRVSLGLVDAYA